jgi:hypothetical protein
MSLLLDGLSFHSPTNGSFAADSAAVTTQATSRNRRAHLSMESSLLLEYGEEPILDDQEWKVATTNGGIELKKS